jgi:hypothetical protein
MHSQQIRVSGVFGGVGVAYSVQKEIRKHGTPSGNTLRCWNCSTVIGERSDSMFIVSSNKVEIGGIPLVSSVWRRCRGGRTNPACRALNLLPIEWLHDEVKPMIH